MIFVALAVTLGMWMERFVIIVISLHQDYLPVVLAQVHSHQDRFRHPARIIRLFFTLVLLFARVLPVIATSEMKASLPAEKERQP